MTHICKTIFTIATVTSSLIMHSCGNNHTIADEVFSAELAYANDDVNATRDICSDILSRADQEDMKASLYGRLSILYMQLNDQSDDPEDIQFAAKCYREAFRLNTDSAMAFYSSLPVDQDKYAMTLSTIVHTLDNPREIPEDHDWDMPQDGTTDSIGMTTEPDSTSSPSSNSPH